MIEVPVIDPNSTTLTDNELDLIVQELKETVVEDEGNSEERVKFKYKKWYDSPVALDEMIQQSRKPLRVVIACIHNHDAVKASKYGGPLTDYSPEGEKASICVDLMDIKTERKYKTPKVWMKTRTTRVPGAKKDYK